MLTVAAEGRDRRRKEQASGEVDRSRALQGAGTSGVGVNRIAPWGKSGFRL